MYDLQDANDWWKALRNTDADTERDCPRVFVVGAPLSFDRVAGVGVPDVEGMLDLIDKEYKDLKLSNRRSKKQYQEAFARLSPLQRNSIVRKAVLKACTLPLKDKRRITAQTHGSEQEKACAQLQANLEVWNLPRGVEILADTVGHAYQAATKRRDKIRMPLVITTNFDGLLEIALRKRRIPVTTHSLVGDDPVEPTPKQVSIWHVHGHWSKGGPMLHTPYQINYPQLDPVLKTAFEGAHVFVMAYGGWNDRVMQVLQRTVNWPKKSAEPTVVYWALHERDRHQVRPVARKIVKHFGESPSGKNNAQFFRGVDVHCMGCENPESLWCGQHRLRPFELTLASNNDRDEHVHATNKMLEVFQKKFRIRVHQRPQDHERFKNDIDDYLNGRPHDVVEWLAGQPAAPKAQKANRLVVPLCDDTRSVVEKRTPGPVRVGLGRFDEDGIVVPFKTYPWAFYYRKSVWKERNYQPPTTWKELIALAKRMRKKTARHERIPFPIAFGNREGWPALMTFDILNLRVNGFTGHTLLLSGARDWTSAAVRNVFERWRILKAFYPDDWPTLSYRKAADLLGHPHSQHDVKAGMYFIGGFIASEVDEAVRNDLGVFPFPEIEKAVEVDLIDAPIDGYVLPAKVCKGRENGRNKLIQFLGTREAFSVYAKYNPGFVGVASLGESDNVAEDGEHASGVQSEAVKLLRESKEIVYGLERELRDPEFSNKHVMPRFQEFLSNSRDLGSILAELNSEQKRRIDLKQRIAPGNRSTRWPGG